MVGTSRTSIATEVMSASWTEAMMALIMSGYWTIDVQYSSVRSPLIPRVENSTIAASGMRKKTAASAKTTMRKTRSEEHTSELQSRGHLVCRLLLEKKKKLTST